MKSLSFEERAKHARGAMPKLVDQIIALLGINETNRIVFYSDRLSKQVPRSRAANAFNQFQRAGLYFEIVRLCALWDAPGARQLSWIVKHGVKMAAMPSFGATHYDKEAWKIVAFLETSPHISAEQYVKMKQQEGHSAHEHTPD